MAIRIGNVLFGFSAIVALGCVAFMLQAMSMGLPQTICAVWAILAFCAIGVGRTAKYLFTGR